MVSIDPNNKHRRGRTFSVKKCVLFCILGILLLPLLAVLFVGGKSSISNTTDSWGEHDAASLSHLRPQRLMRSDEDESSSSSPPDGYFNGFPVHLRQQHQNLPNNNDGNDNDKDSNNPAHSSVHCVGDNYQDDAWLQRSCSFAMLCYDLAEQDFVIFQSHNDQVLERFLQTRPAAKVASTMHQGSNSNNESMGVALGGLNLKWSLPTNGPPTSTSFKWFPRILNATDLTSYYVLPSNTVLVPYHSLSAKNPGHLVWDDFLPIFTLLSMFQLQDHVILPLRIKFAQKLFASCEASDKNEHMCQKMTQKFLPLLVGPDYPYNLTRADTAQFVTTNNNNKRQQRSSNYVCASRGAAGLAALTDHGTKKFHGWMRDDYKVTQNLGRGPLLYEFRNFMLDNLRLLPGSSSTSSATVPTTTNDLQPPYKIAISLASSDIPSRNLDFEKQIDTLQQSFPPDLISIETYSMKDLSVKEQVKIASETAIFITICGGGAVTGMFLPKGAAVILYYLEHGGVEYGVQTHLPAFLDWDLFNNLAYLRTHWLPTQTMDQRVDLRALVLLVRQELEMIQSGILI